jgi:hypothetical protein
MLAARGGEAATLLDDGRVLVLGGYVNGPLSSAELYDPATETWSLTAPMPMPTVAAIATLLANGKVLVTGAGDGSSAELYDPATDSWSSAGSMAEAWAPGAPTLLSNGEVLVSNGIMMELYDPVSNTWSSAGTLITPRIDQTATLLGNGKVLILGGDNAYALLNSTELFNRLVAGALTTPGVFVGQSFSNYTLFHFTDVDPGATPANYSATITWGDGQTSTVSASASADGQIVVDPSGVGFDVLGSHTYTAALANATFRVTVTDQFGVSTAQSGAVTVNAVSSQSLQTALNAQLQNDPSATTMTIEASTDSDAQNAVIAVNGLSAQSTAVTIHLNLASGTSYSDFSANPPAGVTLVITGDGTTTTIVGHSPALTVASGNVLLRGVILTTATDAPTILVTGGHLTLRGCVIEESTAYGQAAVRVTRGSADLGIAADPGGNTLVVNGPGAFLDAAPGAFSEAGDTHVIIKADQAINPAWPTRALGSSGVTLGLTSGSGLPVSYTVTGPATLNAATNLLTITGLGAVTVTAHQAGNDYYNAAPDVSTTYAVAAASLCGVLFKDFNEDGFQDFGELGSAGVSVQLTGTDFNNTAVSLSATTGSSGYFQFPSLLPGTYAVSVPGGLTVTKVTVGLNGAAPVVVGTGHSATGLAVAEGTALNVVNFGLQPAAGDALRRGQTAGIGFWNNRNGQALLKSLNGGGTAGSATQLGGWLASTFTNMFGASGANLAGQSNAQVGAYFQALFATRGDKLEAQVLATALSVYVTNSTLAGGTYSTSYGFTVAAGGGAGLATVNVGSDGAAVGQANGSSMTLMDILLAADGHATHSSAAAGFVLYSGDQATRGLADDLFGRINDTGAL